MGTCGHRSRCSRCLSPLIFTILSSKAPSSRSPWYWAFNWPFLYPWSRTRCPSYGTSFLAMPPSQQRSLTSWKLLRFLMSKCGRWVNSSFLFFESKLRNWLITHLDLVVRMFSQEFYTLNTFVFPSSDIGLKSSEGSLWRGRIIDF